MMGTGLESIHSRGKILNEIDLTHLAPVREIDCEASGTDTIDIRMDVYGVKVVISKGVMLDLLESLEENK